MKVHRMTFDIAVDNGAPDVYTLLSQLKVAMREVAFVVGAEGVGNFGTVSSIDASVAISKQIKDGYAIDLRPCQISICKVGNESEPAE